MQNDYNKESADNSKVKIKIETSKYSYTDQVNRLNEYYQKLTTDNSTFHHKSN